MKQRSNSTQKYILLLLIALSFNVLVYNGGRLIAADLAHHSLAVFMDDRIPFLPWTIFIYWGCFPFWVINYFLGVKSDGWKGFRFLGAHLIGEIICFLCFVLMPTTTVRPEITGDSVTDFILKLTYLWDAADNLFPSIHCFVSWLCWIGVRQNKEIPLWYRWLSLTAAAAVCISTLTVKQHVLADVPAGILLAEISWLLSDLFVRKFKEKHDLAVKTTPHNSRLKA